MAQANQPAHTSPRASRPTEAVKPRADVASTGRSGIAGTSPKATPVKATAAGSSSGTGDDDGSASGSRREWLRYVHAEGEASATVDPNARYISDRNVVAPNETRRAANVIRSNGDSTGDDPLATRVAPAAAPEAGVAAAPPPAETATPGSASTSPSAQARQAARPAARSTPAPAVPAAGGAPRTIATPKEVKLPYVSPAADGGAGGGAGVAIGAVPDPAPVRTEPAAAPPQRTRPARAHRPSTTPPAAPTPAPTAAQLPPTTTRSSPIEDDFWASEPLPLDTPDADEEPEDAPDSALLDVVTAKAAGWSDLAVLDERVALGDKTRFSAKAHPLGAWMRGVDDELRRRWTYPETFRALGIKGNVVVEFRVERSGVVDNVRVTVSSNIPELDLAALSALPKRFAPPPTGRRVQLQYVFRYRQDQR